MGGIGVDFLIFLFFVLLLMLELLLLFVEGWILVFWVLVGGGVLVGLNFIGCLNDCEICFIVRGVLFGFLIILVILFVCCYFVIVIVF